MKTKTLWKVGVCCLLSLSLHADTFSIQEIGPLPSNIQSSDAFSINNQNTVFGVCMYHSSELTSFEWNPPNNSPLSFSFSPLVERPLVNDRGETVMFCAASGVNKFGSAVFTQNRSFFLENFYPVSLNNQGVVLGLRPLQEEEGKIFAELVLYDLKTSTYQSMTKYPHPIDAFTPGRLKLTTIQMRPKLNDK